MDDNRNILKTLLLLTVITKLSISLSTDGIRNDSSTNIQRQPKVHGRVVKSYSGKKPKQFSCWKEGFLPDPEDCTIFYRCVKGDQDKYSVFKFQCGPETVYDPDTETCNHPKQTKRQECGGVSIFSNKQNFDNEIGESNQEFPSPITSIFSDLPKTDNVATSTIIPNIANMSTDTSIKLNLISVIPWVSTSTAKSLSLTLSYHNTKDSNICRSDGFIGDSVDCRKFYRCVNNGQGSFIRYEFLCTESTVWDDSVQACVHQKSVKRQQCNISIHNDLGKNSTTENTKSKSNMTTIKETKTEPKLTQPIKTTTPVSSKYTNEKDINATVRPTMTRESTHFTMKPNLITTMSWKTTTTDNGIWKTSSTPLYETNLDETKNSDLCKSDGFIGDNVDCRKFYRCVSNGRGGFVKYEFSCSEFTVWDDSIEACNHPRSVKQLQCNRSNEIKLIENSISVTNKTKIELSANFTQKQTPKTTESKINQPKTSTLSVYVMSNSKKELNSFTVKPITSTVQYSKEPNFITSNFSKPITTNKTFSKSENFNNSQTLLNPVNYDRIKNDNICSDDGFMGDKFDCRKFYRCVGNGRGGFIKYEFSCGESTIWDELLEVCNYPQSVKRSQCEEFNKIKGSHNLRPILTEKNNNNLSVNYNQQKPEESEIAQTNYWTLQNKIQINSTNDIKQHYLEDNTKHSNYGDYAESIYSESNKENSLKPLSQKQTQEYQKSTEATTIIYEMNKTHKETKYNKEKNKCTKTGFIGDEDDCKKFYRCVDNGSQGYTRYEFSCGDGTVWDQELESCNHAWAVSNCHQKVAKKTTAKYIITTEKQLNADKYSDILYGSHREFISTTLKATNELKPVMIKHDNSKEIVTSDSDQLEIKTEKKLQRENNRCHSSGFQGDKDDCKKFYRCVDNGDGSYTRYEFSCGDGTVWDAKISACNHHWAVKTCGESNVLPTDNETVFTSVKYDSTTVKYDFFQSTEKDKNLDNQTENDHHQNYSSHMPSFIYQCTDEGFFGDKDDCKKFYRCVDDSMGGFSKFEFSCGEGTVWDQEIKSCNHENTNKRCGFGGTTPIQETEKDNGDIYAESTTKIVTFNMENNENTQTTDTPQIINDNNCSAEGFFGDINNCKIFYRCVDYGKGQFVKYDFMCGEGTVWDQKLQVCNHETSNKRCSINQNSDISTQTPKTEPSFLNTSSTTTEYYSSKQPDPSGNSPHSADDKCEKDGFFANSKDCKKFYRCVGDKKGGYIKYDFSCGDGTVWVQEIQACDHETDINSNCKTNKVPSYKEPQVPVTHPKTTTQEPTSANFEDQNADSQKPDNTTHKLSPTKDENCSSEGFFPNPKDCTKFYRCVDDGHGGLTKYDFTCGDGTAWDKEIQTCNHINDVKNCPKPEISTNVDNKPNGNGKEEVSETTETEAESFSQSTNIICKKEGFYGDTNDCKKFYRCVDNGKGGFTKYEYTCGEGTIWDQDITTCNHPQDVIHPTCETKTSTTSGYQSSTYSTDTSDEATSDFSQDDSSKKPQPTKVNCTEAGFYADPNDCKKFYRCVDWDNNGEKFSVFHFDCGEGTIWDPQLETCNYEESVYPPRDCSGIQSQNDNGTSTTDRTTEKSETTTAENEGTTSQQTTKQSTTSEKTTTVETAATQQTITEQTTSEQTTKQSTTSEKTTTAESVVTQHTTTEQTTTTEQKTTEKTSTTKTTPSEQTTAQQSTTSEKSTTQQTEETATQQPSSTTEHTTSEPSSTTEQTTTEQQTTKISQTTTEQSTTTEKTEEQKSTTSGATSQEYTTEEISTTESQSTTEAGQETTTNEPSSSEISCPETDDDQYHYVCPTSFKRHPKYCNLFYQCTENDDTHELKIAVFNCPNNTIYDESKTQCVEEKEADKRCEGAIAQRRRVKRLHSGYKDPIVVSREKRNCPAVGHFPFEKNEECSPAFLKCEKAKSGIVRGFVYLCPKGYVYWLVSRKCELASYLQDCKQTVNDWNGRWEIPVERRNVSVS